MSFYSDDGGKKILIWLAGISLAGVGVGIIIGIIIGQIIFKG